MTSYCTVPVSFKFNYDAKLLAMTITHIAKLLITITVRFHHCSIQKQTQTQAKSEINLVIHLCKSMQDSSIALSLLFEKHVIYCNFDYVLYCIIN